MGDLRADRGQSARPDAGGGNGRDAVPRRDRPVRRALAAIGRTGERNLRGGGGVPLGSQGVRRDGDNEGWNPRIRGSASSETPMAHPKNERLDTTGRSARSGIDAQNVQPSRSSNSMKVMTSMP